MPIKAPNTAIIQEMWGITRKVSEQKTTMSNGINAAQALEFFSYQANGMRAEQVASIDIELRSTSGYYDQAKAYLRIAAFLMLEEIIQRAIDMAQEDFDKAKSLLPEMIDEEK